jgi:hypothetical protein
MTIWCRHLLIIPFVIGFTCLSSACGYRLGRPATSIHTVMFSFSPGSMLSLEEESMVRQASWSEVRRRVEMGGDCILEIRVTEASYTPSLGAVSRVRLSVNGRLGEGERVRLEGNRSFSANSPIEAAEERLETYAELSRSLVSEIMLQLLTDVVPQCR